LGMFQLEPLLPQLKLGVLNPFELFG